MISVTAFRRRRLCFVFPNKNKRSKRNFADMSEFFSPTLNLPFICCSHYSLSIRQTSRIYKWWHSARAVHQTVAKKINIWQMHLQEQTKYYFYIIFSLVGFHLWFMILSKFSCDSFIMNAHCTVCFKTLLRWHFNFWNS